MLASKLSQQQTRPSISPFGGCCSVWHTQVGSAVLLLSRFIGLQWNADEAVRLAEEKTASASEAVNRLSDNVGTLEQRLTAAEESKVGGAKGESAGGGGATPTLSSLVGTETVAHGAQFAECVGVGGGGGGIAPPDDAGDGTISSPSLLQNKSLEATAGTTPVASEAEEGAKRSGSAREVLSDQNLRQASTAESARNVRLSSSSRNGGDEESGGDITAPSASGRSEDGDTGDDEESSASGAAGPAGRRYNRAEIDNNNELGSSRRRRSSGGGGGDRRKDGRSGRSVEGHPVNRPLPDPAAEQGVPSLSSSRRVDDEKVTQQPSTSRLSPLRRSLVSAITEGGRGSSDTVGTNLNPAPREAAVGAATTATTVLIEEGKEQVALMGGGDFGADTNSRRLPVSAGDRTLSSSRAEQELQARELSAATGEADSKVRHEIEDGEGDQDKEELIGARTGENTSSTASEKTVAGAGTTAVTAASEVDSSGAKESAVEAEDSRKTVHAATVEEGERRDAKLTGNVASSAASATVPSRNRPSTSETPGADELALSASARKETLGMNQTDIHGSGRGQDEDKETTPYATPQAAAARNTGTTAPVVVARSNSSASESIGVDSPGRTDGETSIAAQKGADEKKPNGDKDDEGRGRGDGERRHSDPAAGEPGGSLAAGSAGAAPLGDGVRRSSCSKGSLQPGDRTLDVPKTSASGAIKLDPMEPRPTCGGSSAEGAAEFSETAKSTGRTHGGSISHDTRFAKTRVSTEVEDGEQAEGPMSSGRRSTRERKADSTAAQAGVVAAVSEANNKSGDREGRSGGGRSFSDESSHTSGGGSWTSRTGDSRSSSEQSTAASTRVGSPDEKGRAADSASVKRSSSGSGGRRRRSRSRSKNQVNADGVGGIAGREDKLHGGAQKGDHQPKLVAVSDKRRASDHRVHAEGADNAIAAVVAAAHPPQRGSSSG